VRKKYSKTVGKRAIPMFDSPMSNVLLIHLQQLRKIAHESL
jgi:hypothetical protein